MTEPAGGSAEMVISLRRVSKYYGKSRGVIDLDLEIARGEIFGYLGPNGAGKTTTIRLLLDLLRPTSGSLSVLGGAPVEPAIRRRIGYLPGELSMYDNLTGAELLTYLASLRGAAGTGEAPSLAERLGLDLTRPIRDLSKGNKQKIGLVQSLMNRPELLVLDEPTSGLDPLVQLECYEMLSEAREAGATLFLSSHVLPEVERLADRVGIVREGRLVTVDTLDALRAQAVRHFEVVFASEVGVAAAGHGHAVVRELEQLASVSDVTVEADTVRCAVTGDVDGFVKAIAAHRVDSLSSQEADLESMFLAYYEGGSGEA